MKTNINILIKRLTKLYIKYEETQIKFPQYVILIFRIHQSFISLSYLFEENKNSYLKIIAMFARPQIFLPYNEVFQFLIFLLCFLYIINKHKTLWFSLQIRIFGVLLQTGLLNFFFEYSIGKFQIITHATLILISITEQFIFQETLNAQTVNFKNTRITLYEMMDQIINYIIMILYAYKLGNQIIKFLILINIILKAFNQIYNSPTKNHETQSILLSIYFFTILITVILQFNEQNLLNFEFLLIPVIYKLIIMIYYRKLRLILSYQENKQYDIMQVLLYLQDIFDIKKIQIKKPIGSRDQIIYCSLLMLQEKNYEAYQELMIISQKKLNVLEQFKLQSIIRQCLNKIEIYIKVRQYEEQKETLMAQSLMISEQQNSAILNDIIEILREKKLKQKLLVETQTSVHFQQYFALVEKIIILKNQLENYYYQFASLKTQSILCFFYVEVINDYLAANYLYSEMQMIDDKMKRITRCQEQSTSKMSYIITKFDEDFKIQKVSNDAPKIFGMPQEYFKGKQINVLIPPGIAQNHDELVTQFLRTGQSKYFRNFDLIFLFKEIDCQMMDIQFAFDINFMNDFTFIAFFQKVERKSLSLVINSQNIISCLSQGILQNLYEIKYYLGCNINQVIKDFSTTNQTFQNVENAVILLTKINQFDNQNYIITTNYTIYSRYLEDQLIYRIIFFEFFLTQNVNQQTNSQLTLQQISTDGKKNSFVEINQESLVNIPYMDPNSKKFELEIQNSNFLEKYDQNVKNTTLNEIQQFQNESDQKLMSPKDIKTVFLSEQKSDKQFLRSKDVEKFQLQVDYIQEKSSQQQNFIYQEENSSQISSLMGIKSSLYYKKFRIVNKILDNNIFRQKIDTYIILFIVCLFTQSIIQTMQLVSINLNFNNLISDIDLLQINNFIFQPLETFLITRYTIVIYRQQKDAQIITTQKYYEQVQFPRANIAISYNQLQQNLKYLTQQPELQRFLEENYFEVYVYKQTGVGEKYNMSLRNCIDILKNHQYTLKMAYIIDGIAYADSPSTYYQYKNYLPMKKLFFELNDKILFESIQSSKQLSFQIIILFSISFVTLVLFSIAIIYANYLIRKKLLKFFQLMQNVSRQHLEIDQKRLMYLIEKVDLDYNILQKYKFNLQEKEKSLETRYEQTSQYRKSKQKIEDWHTFDISQNLIFILCFVLILGNSFVTYYEGQLYLAKYPDTAQFYKELSDLGTDVPTMFAQREVLYGRRNINLYTEQECSDIINLIKNAVNRTSLFLDKSISYQNYIVTDSFKQYFEQIENSNLCNFIPDEFLQQSIGLCDIVLQSNLQRGLKVVLAYMINFIGTDMEINQFVTKTVKSNFELEGAFLVSNVISAINKYFNQDLQKQTQRNNFNTNLHNILILVIIQLLIIFIVTYLKQKIQFRLSVVQRFIYILPPQTLFLDNQFERNIRQLSNFYK